MEERKDDPQREVSTGGTSLSIHKDGRIEISRGSNLATAIQTNGRRRTRTIQPSVAMPEKKAWKPCIPPSWRCAYRRRVHRRVEHIVRKPHTRKDESTRVPSRSNDGRREKKGWNAICNKHSLPRCLLMLGPRTYVMGPLSVTACEPFLPSIVNAAECLN